MKSEDRIKRLAKNIRIEPDATVDERVLTCAKSALAKSTKERDAVPLRHPSIWRIIMKSPVIKLTAAAAIVIGVFVLTFFFMETGKNVVLADVLARVEQARAFMYKMEMTMTMIPKPAGKQQIKGTAVICDEYGMKAQVEITDTNTDKTTTQQIYFLPDQKLMLTLIPGEKKCMRVELDEDLFVSKKKENNDPREMLKQILACKYTELGRSDINGIKVEGFKTTDPEFSAGTVDQVEVTLWVDVETRLPVLWEMDVKQNEVMEIHAVISDFQWDIPVVASDFEPVIPADYTSLEEDGYKMPSMAKETARVYREKSPATDHCERGEAHYFNGEYEKAFSELTKAIEIDPGFARAYVTRGMAYKDKGEHDLAIADFTMVIEIKPTAARAYVTRGMAYEDKNEHDLAIADFTKVIKLKPTDAHAYIYRGMAYKNKGEYDLAVADYSKAIEIDPMITDAYRGRAGAYYYKGEYDKAWKDVYKAQARGQKVDSELLQKLRKASGIDE
jgi:tetratricopeptide (TPR) repeat protein